MSVYLDHNATTPLDERVLAAMLPYQKNHYGNPSSVHRFGRQTRAAIETARQQVANLVNVMPSQVVFTSGGTEANNYAIKGIAGLNQHPGSLAISAIEHASVIEPARAMQRLGWKVDTISVDNQGRVPAEAIDKVFEEKPQMISVMMANNETGTVQDIAAISDKARAVGTLVHTDAVQSIGKIDVDFNKAGVHMMTLSAHKLYGPKGVGALIVDKSLELEPILHGGGHEKGRRGGTENVMGIVGFGCAAEIAQYELYTQQVTIANLLRRLETSLAEIPEVVIFAQQAKRLPNTLFFALPGIDGETLLMNLDKAGFAVSSGSACESSELEPSHVLLAMGVDQELARSAIRVSLGKDNTQAEIDSFVAELQTQVDILHTMGLRATA